MNATNYILKKQQYLAINKRIELIGSHGDRGQKSYTTSLDQNLFEPLSLQARAAFSKGDGNEINGKPNRPAKMQAVHSSSAIGVNVFHYWQSIYQASTIAAACGFCRKGSQVAQNIVFEDKYNISPKFQFSPNIDVVFHNAQSAQYKRFAVECKFSEAYGSRPHGGMDPKYIKLADIWNDIPNTCQLAKTISPNDNEFRYLHVAQLIKHILGLKSQFKKGGFRLLYLWYDVLGEEGATHRAEIERFSGLVKQDGIKFHWPSYKELILKLADQYRSDHGPYINYLASRYL